jgi:hypothetical protein
MELRRRKISFISIGIGGDVNDVFLKNISTSYYTVSSKPIAP